MSNPNNELRRQLASNGKIDAALLLADSLTERIQLYVDAGQREDARDVAREALHDYTITDVEVGDDTITAYCGPFTGYHSIRDHVAGGASASTYGSYVHDPTGVEFEAECPVPGELDDHVRRAVMGPSPSDAARHEYRRTRL